MPVSAPEGFARWRPGGPTDGDLGIPGARRVKPLAKEASVLFERMRRFDRTRMPPLGSDLADEYGADLIGTWIDGLP